MTQPEHYDDIVLGSGAGGKLLAWHLAASGRRTAVVERRWIGGSCPNVACLPSKNEIWSAKVADLLAHGEQFGAGSGRVAVVRTHTTGESQGFMKALVEAQGNRILGFAMLGAEAGEVLAAVQTAMLGGLPTTLLQDAILTHPTMAEGLNGLFATLPASDGMGGS